MSKLILRGACALGCKNVKPSADLEQAEVYVTLIRHAWGYRNSMFSAERHDLTAERNPDQKGVRRDRFA